MGCCYPVGAHLWCKSHLTNASPAGQARTPRASPAMGVRSWSERGGRPRDCAPTYGESWSAGEPQRDRGQSRRRASAGRQQSCARQRRVCRTPPGSEGGACLQRGSSGTWENHLSPCTIPRWGDRATTGPGVTWGFRPGHEPYGDTTNTRKQARYRGGERQAKPPETGRAAVVAEHSTEEGGEVRPKRPTGGKAPSSRASAGGT